MKLDLRTLALFLPVVLCSATGCDNTTEEDDVDSVEGSKKVKPGTVDPDLRGYFVAKLPNAANPVANAKYYLDEDSITLGTPFLVAVTPSTSVTRQFKVCYDGAKKLCTVQAVAISRKTTTEHVLRLINVRVTPPKVPTVPASPTPDFGPQADRFSPGAASAVTIRLPGAVLAYSDATVLPSVHSALDGAGTKYVPVTQATTSWSAEAAGASVGTPSADGYITTASLLMPDARAEAPQVLSVHPPVRENPNAFPQTYEFVLIGPQTAPSSSDNTVWGPSYSSPAGIDLAPYFTGNVIMRAKGLSTSSDSALKHFTTNVAKVGGQYGFVLNRKQYTTAKNARIERIDVDDPTVTNEATGATYTVKGKWTLQDNYGRNVYAQEFATGTGVDVLLDAAYVIGSASATATNNTYIVRTTFTTASGPQVQSHTMTF